MNIDLNGADALLMVGASERSADLYWATGFKVPDPVVFLWTGAEKILMTSNLELDRARAQARVDRVVAAPVYEQKTRDRGVERPTPDQVLAELLGELGLQRLRVPADFALSTADFLRQSGFHLEVAPAPLFPQRQIKSPEETQAIHRALEAAEAGMETAVQALRRARVQGGALYLDGQVLTAERLRRLIHRTLLERDCTARHTIVAPGEQGCDPHQEGRGPLREGEPIIIDIFPQEEASGYFGDLTRTLVRGRAPQPVQALYQTVQRGQELVLGRVAEGADGKQIHEDLVQFFKDAGYETGEKNGFVQGFFHGTGHGLGLDIHEAPRIGTRGEVLKEGQVLTVEPGLYYRGVGGVRLEDVVVVRRGGCENLTSFPKFLEI
jgi:Xaa-Pro aminopeptidase